MRSSTSHGGDVRGPGEGFGAPSSLPQPLVAKMLRSSAQASGIWSAGLRLCATVGCANAENAISLRASAQRLPAAALLFRYTLGALPSRLVRRLSLPAYVDPVAHRRTGADPAPRPRSAALAARGGNRDREPNAVSGPRRRDTRPIDVPRAVAHQVAAADPAPRRAVLPVG